MGECYSVWTPAVRDLEGREDDVMGEPLQWVGSCNEVDIWWKDSTAELILQCEEDPAVWESCSGGSCNGRAPVAGGNALIEKEFVVGVSLHWGDPAVGRSCNGGKSAVELILK